MSHWQQGPLSTRLLKKHDRPIYCLAVDPKTGSIVTGSGDHTLRLYDGKSGSYVRELYGKGSQQYGHTEWVTTAAFLPDGRVVSGGMDSQICVWPRGSARSENLKAHGASISKLKADSRDVVLSASYDKTVKVWDLSGRTAKCQLTFDRHMQAVMTFDWLNSLVVSGDRNGRTCLWDVNTGQTALEFNATGSTLAIAIQKATAEGKQPGDLVAVGAEGILTLIDGRTNEFPFQQRLTSGAKGTVADIVFTSTGLVLAAMSDGRVDVVDLRRMAVSAKLMGHKAPVTACRLSPDETTALSVAANGWLLAHDLQATGNVQSLYGFGVCTQGATNCLEVTGEWAVAAGEDGIGMVLDYVRAGADYDGGEDEHKTALSDMGGDGTSHGPLPSAGRRMLAPATSESRANHESRATPTRTAQPVRTSTQRSVGRDLSDDRYGPNTFSSPPPASPSSMRDVYADLEAPSRFDQAPAAAPAQERSELDQLYALSKGKSGRRF